tara:strand:- start:281 stop:1126 length:846 start_codon:yes stop_codon:yes gene_type:complete
MSEVEQQPSEIQGEPSASPEEMVSPAPVVPPPNVPSEGRQERRDRIHDGLTQYLENAIEDDRVAQDEILNGEGGHKGIDYNEVMTNLPEEAKKLLSNMRSDYTRKTMELSQERKALEKMRESLSTNDEFNKQLQEAAEEEFEFNPYDETSFQKAVEREVAQKLQEMMKPVRQQHELTTRKLQLQQFKSDNPDLESYKHDVAKLLMSDESLSLEKAYWIVKGQKLSQQQSTQSEELAQYRKAARDAGLRVGGASRARGGGVPASVKAQGSWAIYKYLEATKK